MTFNGFPAIEGAEFLPLADIASIQAQRWSAQLDFVAACSPFYQRLWCDKKPDQRLEALADLPLTSKEMLREDQRAHAPFGSYLTADTRHIARVHRTSGTTGVAMNLALSATDATMTAEVGGRAQRAAGLGPGFRVVHCLNYRLWMGGFSDHTTLEATGATVIPYGVGETEKLIRTIQDLGIDAISCTPSFPAVLEQVMARSFPELEPKGLGLKLGLFGGEAGLDDPAFRERLESTWGFRARNANYGVSDVLCNFAAQSEIDNDLHLVALDVLYPELVDPQSLALLPWREGERGELVLTHLGKQCQPLVRFRSGDIIQLTGLDTAACGRTAPRFRVIGRADDMVVIRGINVFPTMVAAVINRFAQLNGEYRLLFSAPPPHDFLPLEVEMIDDAQAGPELSGEIEAQIKKDIGVTARVQLLATGALGRTEGKTPRVVRTWQEHNNE